MSITQYKALTWIVSLGVGGYLGYYVYDFFQHKNELAEAVSQETQFDVLTSVPTVEPPKDDVVDYDLVRATWHDMDWTGKPPPLVVDTAEDEGPTELPKKKVVDLLSILLVQVDGGKPESSMAHVSYKDPQLLGANPDLDDAILREGDILDSPHDYVQVAHISRSGVSFRFVDADGNPDETREDELVPTSQLEGSESIVRVGADGAVLPTRPDIPTARREKEFAVPGETMLIGKDHWLVGLDDRSFMADNYTKILAEIRYDKHRDSKTGKIDGIELKDVPKGSFAAKYGAKAGQIIKSVNGHPVTSVSEAISFAKQNKDKFDVWTIVYEEQGKEHTKIIDTSE